MGADPSPGAERIQCIDPKTPEVILLVRVVIVVASMVDNDNERSQLRRLDVVYRAPCSSRTTTADIDEGAATSRAQVDANPGRVRSAVRQPGGAVPALRHSPVFRPVHLHRRRGIGPTGAGRRRLMDAPLTCGARPVAPLLLPQLRAGLNLAFALLCMVSQRVDGRRGQTPSRPARDRVRHPYPALRPPRANDHIQLATGGQPCRPNIDCPTCLIPRTH